MKPLTPYHRIACLLSLLLLVTYVVAGCAQLGLATAKSFDERLAYAYGVNTAVREASTSALNAKTIASTDMEHVLKLTDEARGILDAARVASRVGDLQTAEARLLLATNILAELQAYLRNRGVKANLGDPTWA